MSELGGGTRRARRGGTGWFKRRRQPARSRTATQTALPGRASERGDLCQLEAGSSGSTFQPATQFNLWKWLSGGKRSLRGGKARHAQIASASASGRAMTARERYEQRRKQTTTSTQGVHDYVSRLPRSQSSERSAIAPLSQRGQLERRSSRDRNRPTSTRLPTRQPTLIQASTSLQQNTLLQNGDTVLEPRHSNRSRKRQEVPTRPRSRSLAIALYAARMLILSVGVGVLAGTVLSTWNPATHSFLSSTANQAIKQASSGTAPQPATATALPLSQEIAAVKTALQGTAQPYSGFTPGVFLFDLDTNSFVDWSGSATFSAASTIKVPVLIAFFQDVDAGKIRLDEKLTMRKDLIAPESGDMQFLPVGAQFSALETANKMITISDNTATNMLIDRLGGIQALNQRFKSWGLTATQIISPLPDLKGTNTTSPKELATLMVRVSQGELVSLRSRDRMLDIMRRTVNNSQLPQGLGEGATIAHKTGDIGSVIGDVGLIDLPSGKRYATAVMVKRAVNDDRAYDLVQKISRVMYQYFATTAPKRPGAPTTLPTTPFKPNLEPEDGNTDTQTPTTPDGAAQGAN